MTIQLETSQRTETGRGKPAQGGDRRFAGGGEAAERTVGVVLAFTGHYDSVKVIARFLELAGLRVVKSRLTTPRMLEVGTTLASTDFCTPLRAYVGHVHQLIENHPDLDAIVAPNVVSEDGITSTCAKYRDLGGVAIRSLGDTLGYLLKRTDQVTRDGLRRLAGAQAVDGKLERSRGLPDFIMPSVKSLSRLDMRNTCYDVYADVMGWSKLGKVAFFLPRRTRELDRIEAAFERAYAEMVTDLRAQRTVRRGEEGRPRLGLVGRKYLIQDPLLTCDLRGWFLKRGVTVLTAEDVPFDLLQESYLGVNGFYDTHRESVAFIDWAADQVDGFISLGTFGCHPDAFQIDYFAEYARSLGVPTWTLRYDEAAGWAGFYTRYETILAFLEQRRDKRLSGSQEAVVAAPAAVAGGILGREPAALLNPVPGRLELAQAPTGRRPADSTARPKTPLIIWPYMGEILNLVVEEACWQMGLQDFVHPPAPLSEEAIVLGNTHYPESCSPYACSTGTLKKSIREAMAKIEAEAARTGRPVEPRRIIILMARGVGPCTFGWYAIAQQKHLPEEFRVELARHGHTLELATLGLDEGLVEFVRDLSAAGDSRRLRAVLDYVEALEEGLDKKSWVRRVKLKAGLLAFVKTLSKPLWAKLDAGEELRARSLILRAHELQPGATSAALRQAYEHLRRAHGVRQIKAAHRQGIAILGAVARDDRVKPRVVSVGEIYVALTSFGNRGAIENLLGREGIEVVEGITLGGFIRHMLREARRRGLANHPLVRPALAFLRQRNVYLLEQRIREPEARPFLVHEVGGDGLPTVGHARHYVEAGCHGIIHTYPFKCMPEGMAKDAVKEIADLYSVRYLSLSFDKETEIERLKTEVSTFAALLRGEVVRSGGDDPAGYELHQVREVARRREIGRQLIGMYERYRSSRHLN